jgi:hypothetical protein
MLDSASPPCDQHSGDTVEAAPEKPRPGRPKGSKNKAKAGPTLAEAISILKAAGYHVHKPRKSKQTPQKCVGPTFRCRFADGTTTHMTTFSATAVESLDWTRGQRLARQAWASRRKVPFDWDSAKLAEVAPSIIACRFEQDGEVLAQRGDERAQVVNDQPSLQPSPSVLPKTFWLSFANGEEASRFAIIDLRDDEIGKAEALFAAIRKSLALGINPGPDYVVDGREIEGNTVPEEFKHRLLGRAEAETLSPWGAP